MVCSECSLNLVAGQVFLGACSVSFCRCLFRRFFQRSLLPRYQCSRLHCFCPSLYEFLAGIKRVKCIHPNEVLPCKKNYVNFGDVLVTNMNYISECVVL